MEKRIDLQSFDEDAILQSRTRRTMAGSKGQQFDRDRYELARVGKKQVLKVSAVPAYTHTYADVFPSWSDSGSVASDWYR